MKKRVFSVISGIVQGVGFRPYVYQLASRFGLAGYVLNTGQGVDLEVEGTETDIESFFETLLTEPPPLAHIASVTRRDLPPKGHRSFQIMKSRAGEERSTLIPPDVCICADCLSELHNPHDRRFRYPFINCTNCGPRYTIIRDIPYDRPKTTMNAFTMCEACRAEYQDPTNRRFHAQPNACWDCGPTVRLRDGAGNPVSSPDPVSLAIHRLASGQILAIKGLGGFHLAVDASNHRAVTRLRRRKHRQEKPLAVMVKDLDTAKSLVHVNAIETQLLCSPQRPVVLLKKRRSNGLSPQVAPRNRFLGIMLPYTPLHHLLMEGPYKALVMTSGNISEEPINIRNEEAVTNLNGVADAFLVHDREIHLRTDDSVTRVVGEIPRQIRRSRGYVPRPVFLSEDLAEMAPVIAVGAEVKNTICLTKENRAFLSQHIGDMENLETYDFFLQTIDHLKRILEIRPAVLARDLHPDYLSSGYAREQTDLPIIEVQHHHAHIVSCLAEHGLAGPVIGLAMDGAGYGPDGHIWGGEILLADLTSFHRAAYLDYVALPGGDTAAKSPRRMAIAYLEKAYGNGLFDLPIPFLKGLDRQEAAVVVQMIRRGLNTPLTSSCGRLFDAVSSLLNIRHRNSYEGQAAVELEHAQRGKGVKAYSFGKQKTEDGWVMLTLPIIRSIVEDLSKGISRGAISRRFHNTLVSMFTDMCCTIRMETGIDAVAMSGGTFQNATLLTGLTRSLAQCGFKVYSHALIPTNDGCLALGQAVCGGLLYGGVRGRFAEQTPSFLEFVKHETR
jgi:hydrogenase maturation protein HypF